MLQKLIIKQYGKNKLVKLVNLELKKIFEEKVTVKKK